jgi:hypothetical protein
LNHNHKLSWQKFANRIKEITDMALYGSAEIYFEMPAQNLDDNLKLIAHQDYG